MSETLQEFADSRGMSLRVDAEAGVLRGVKILGLESRNGRIYLPDALRQAAALYEGAKVNVNHPKGSPLGPRDYQDRIGQIRNVAVRPEAGLFGDLHFNPKHALAEQLVWDAQHAPENVGFSHNVEARTVRRGEQLVVEAITRVQSVDLVADPATTRGLFEAAARESATIATEATEAVATEVAPRDERLLSEVTLDEIKVQRPDLCAQLIADETAELEQLRAEIHRLRALEAHNNRPRSRDQVLLDAWLTDRLDAKEFVRAIT